MATSTTSTSQHVQLDADDAEDILYQLLDDMREFMDQFTQPSPLPSEEAEALWRHSHALAALALALVYARLGRPDGQPAPAPPAAPAEHQVKPATVARLQALRSEFAEDPAGIDLVIDLAGRLATLDPAQAAPVPAQAPA